MSTKRPDSASRIFSAPAVRSSRADRGLCADREESFLMYWGLFLFSQNVIYNNSAQNQGDQKARRSLCICGCGCEAKKLNPERKMRSGFSLVPLTGIEPVRCCHRGILSPLRLPIPPQRLMRKDAQKFPFEHFRIIA